MTLIRTKFKGPSRFCYYYLITNLLTGRRYVGSRTINGKNPLDDTGYMGSSVPLKNDIEKYGISNFSKVILRHERFVDKVTLCLHESQFMHQYQTLRPNGYNGYDPGRRPGYNHSGCRHSETSRAKQSERKTEYWHDEENRAKQSERMKLVQNRLEVNTKRSERMKEYWQDAGYKKKVREKMTEYWHDEENRAKQSEKLRHARQRPDVKVKYQLLWNTPSFKEKMGQINKEKMNRTDVKARLSAAAKKDWAERRERQRALGII